MHDVLHLAWFSFYYLINICIQGKFLAKEICCQQHSNSATWKGINFFRGGVCLVPKLSMNSESLPFRFVSLFMHRRVPQATFL